MDETFFYVVGGALVVLALAVTFAGMRNEAFPSARALRGMIAIFVVLVVSTATGAVLLARAEQEHRREELNHAAAEEAHAEEIANEENAGQATEGQAAGGGGETPGEETDGETLFVEAGCGDCHSFGAAGTAGAIGPNLDETLVDQDVGYVQQSIIDPNAVIAEGYGEGIMPSTYSQELSEAEIAELAAYIHESVAGSAE